MDALRLVIIEDEQAHFHLMKRAIHKAFPGASVEHFTEADICLQRLSAIAPDVIITDYLIPGMNGIEFLKAAKGKDRDIPVIIITGQGDENIAVQAMKLGASDYLVKAGDFFTLLPSVIERVVDERKLRQSLERSESRFKHIFERSPIGIALHDRNGLLCDANKSWLQIFGVSDVADMKGFKLFDCWDISSEAKQRLLEGESVRHEVLFDFNKAGEGDLRDTTRTGMVHLDVLVTPVSLWADDYADAYLVQIQDITEQKQAKESLQKAHDELERRVEARTAELTKANEALTLEVEERKRAEKAMAESEERYRKIVETAHEGIWVIDANTRVQYVNQQMASMLGYTVEEMLGTLLFEYVSDLAAIEAHQNFQNSRRAPVKQHDFRFRRKDGSDLWAMISTSPVFDDRGQFMGALGMIIDITERKQAEERLRKANEQLKGFVDVVSHDLKNPIFAVKGFSTLLLRKYEEALGEKGREYLEHIQESASRMASLVSDLLSLSRLGQVAPALGEASSLEIIRAVASNLDASLNENEVELVVADDLPTIYCDRDRIYQVFDNLVTNALKFTKGAEHRKVEIGYVDQGDSHQFYVKDNGVGIAREHHRKIFELFHRLEETEAIEGTGLGLAIVEKIVTEHGGRVWVESERGKGATFRFTVPKP